MKFLSFQILCLLMLLDSNSYCQSTITFDDVSATGLNSHLPPVAIPNGYQGFAWNNFYFADTTQFPTSLQSGIVNGGLSAPNVAISAESSPIAPNPTVSILSASAPFILVSGYFTSAFLNDMSLEIAGFNGTTEVFDQSYTLNVSGPSFLTFPSSQITEVDFTPSGGVNPGSGYLGGGSEMVLDNLTVLAVPEPSTDFIFSIGAAATIWVSRKKFTS